MGTVSIRIPLVTWRAGRPRYFASATQRKLGFKGEDLRHGPDGNWFTLDECIAWSKQRQAEIAAATEARQKAVKDHKTRPRFSADVVTLSMMVSRCLDQPRYQGKAIATGRKVREAASPHTIRQYNGAARVLENLDDVIWHSPVAAISPKVLEGVLDRVEIRHGLATARSVRAMLSVAWKYGQKNMGVIANPVTSQTLPVPAPRIRYGERHEIAALIDCADRLGLPEIGDSIMLGVWTGQRQADRLSLTGGQLVDNAFLFKQQKKHGQPLLIPASDALAARLEAARERRKDWRINYPHIVLDERRRRPFAADWYRKLFRVVCVVAATGKPPSAGKLGQVARGLLKGRDLETDLQGFEPVATLDDFTDQDLRDTAVTWLALAGCELPEIASITGHSLKTVQDVLKHYMGMHPGMARSAIAKLSIYMEGGE